MCIRDRKYRQRYVDLIMNPDTRRTFEIRSKFIKHVRDFLDNRGLSLIHIFVISLSETDIALVKEVAETAEAKDLYKIALTIEKAIQTELGIKTVIGVGSPAKHLRELPDKYKEAQVAIDVGKVFDTEKTIINYENLGIGRLIYQLPTCLLYTSRCV